MPEPTATEAGKALREATLGYLWRQLRAVGATASTEQSAHIIVDPEALILMSLWMLEHERRLADVIWSWVSVNSSLLSIQRLGNLCEGFPAEVSHRLTGLAQNRFQAKDIRWKSLAIGKNTEDLGERSAKTRAVQPRLHTWATLMLQFRLGMGVGVKADALTFVLGLNPNVAEWTSVAMIADGLGYTPAAVRRAADDLARARFIVTLDTAESEQTPQRMFGGKAKSWGELLNLSVNMHGWGFWRERYLFVIEVLSWLDREASKPTTAYARDVAAREILIRHGMALRKHQIVDPIEFATAELNWIYLVEACRRFAAWVGNNG